MERELFIEVGKSVGINVVCIMTDGNRPQGKFIGNYLALQEVVSVLRESKTSSEIPTDKAFREQIICFATEMLKLCFPKESEEDFKIQYSQNT